MCRASGISRAGQALDVSGLSFQLFAYLPGQGQRVVGFDELIQAVWAPAVVGEETVTQRVKLLRQALGDDARRPRYLRSVRGQGYQLVDLPVALAGPPQQASPSSPRAPRWIDRYRDRRRARGGGGRRPGLAPSA